MLIKMGELLKRCLSLDDVYAVFAQYGGDFFPQCGGGLYVMNEETELTELVAQWGIGLPNEAVFALEDCKAVREHLPSACALSEDQIACEHVRMTMQPEGFKPYLCIPLSHQNEVLGLLHFQFDREEDVKNCETLALVLADLLSLVVINLRLREQLEMQTVKDPLTGLFNRRYLLETINRNIFHPERKEYPVSVIMIDIDRFRSINDEYGFAAGDQVLKAVGEFIKGHIRGSDIACRYGGEEFVIILPGLPLEPAVKRLESIREEIKSLKVDFDGKSLPELTFSQGLAIFPQNGGNMIETLRLAGVALRRAKQQGYDNYSIAD